MSNKLFVDVGADGNTTSKLCWKEIPMFARAFGDVFSRENTAQERAAFMLGVLA